MSKLRKKGPNSIQIRVEVREDGTSWGRVEQDGALIMDAPLTDWYFDATAYGKASLSVTPEPPPMPLLEPTPLPPLEAS